MGKQEFLLQLQKGLTGLPQVDVEERLSFYSEMIDDRMEEGLSEEDAVLAAGSVQNIISQTIADIPFAALAKERVKKKGRLKAWEITMLVLGAPLWLPLVIAAAAVVLSLYISLWSVIISLWAVFGSLAGCAFGITVGGIVLACIGHTTPGMSMLAVGFLCAGLSIFAFFGCKAATGGILKLTQTTVLGIKNRFVKKEET